VQFVLGLSSIARGVGRLVSTPTLWAYAVAPVAVTLAVLVTIAILLMGPALAWAKGLVGESAWTSGIVAALYWIVFAALLLFTFSALVRVVAAPFLALLADRSVEELSGAPAPQAPGGKFVRWVARPFAESVAILLIHLGVTLVALPLLLVPVVGAVVFGAVMMGLVGLDFLDVALSGRGLVLGERLVWIGRHAAACFGLGIGAGLLLLIPCVNALLLPAIVVGAVLLDASLSPDFPRRAAVPA
jgi:CysZ protein